MKIKENLFLRYNPDFQTHHYTSEELIFKVNNMRRRTSYMLRRYRIKATIHNIFPEDLNDEKCRSGVWILRSIKWFQILNALHDDIAGSITTATTTTIRSQKFKNWAMIAMMLATTNDQRFENVPIPKLNSNLLKSAYH